MPTQSAAIGTESIVQASIVKPKLLIPQSHVPSVTLANCFCGPLCRAHFFFVWGFLEKKERIQITQGTSLLASSFILCLVALLCLNLRRRRRLCRSLALAASPASRAVSAQLRPPRGVWPLEFIKLSSSKGSS